MRSEHLSEQLAALKEHKWTPAQKLKEAYDLLEQAANALDVLEGQVQDLKEEKPDKWHTGILDALDEMPTDQIAPYLYAGAERAAIDHGYTSPEYESMTMLAGAIASPATIYK